MYIDMIENKVRLVTSRYIQLLQAYPVPLRAPEEYSLHEFCLVIILFVIGLSKSPSLPIRSSFFVSMCISFFCLFYVLNSTRSFELHNNCGIIV